jgi:hypothetical protein
VLSGSIDGLGTDFQPLRINGLEMVDQNIASWNRLVTWLEDLSRLRNAA